MQPLMHCLEVTLRNSIDYAIRHHSHTGVAGLWRTDSNWIYDLPRYKGDKAFIRQNKRYRITKAGAVLDGQHGRSLVYDRTAWEEQCVRKVDKRIKDAGKTATAERVIAGLEFGFWTNLLTNEYEEPRHNTLLWPHLLPEVFPGMPVNTKRHVVEKKFFRIRELRNRLAHHEAIWKFQYEDPNTGMPDYSNPVYGLTTSLSLLRRAWDDMLEALSWISPSRHTAFLAEGHNSRFETLATKEGLHSFIKNPQMQENLHVNRGIRNLLRKLEGGNVVRIRNHKQTVAIVGPDFIRTFIN